MTTNSTLPSYRDEPRRAARWLHETWDHLWPWSLAGLRGRSWWLAASLLAALLTSLAWGAAALGELSRLALIAWWFGWSVLEIGVRLRCKPYIKEGPWWRAHWRVANRMDMLCYVLFKNLLLGSLLYLALNALGLLVD